MSRFSWFVITGNINVSVGFAIGYGVLVSKYKDGLAIANASTTTKGIYYLNPQTDKINPIPMITTIGNPMAIEWFGN